jgi:hypothetical protein
MWQLPEEFQLVDQKEEEPQEQSTIPVEPQAEAAEATEVPEEEGMIIEMVEGFPEWRKVDRGDGMPYFFHMETQETRWEPPTAS